MFEEERFGSQISDMAYVKKCPTCGYENLLTAWRCNGCRISLAGVPKTCVEGTVGQSENIHNVSLVEEKILCPSLDCGAENLADRERCLICNATLRKSASSNVVSERKVKVIIVWPWGESEVGGRLAIGRDPKFSELARYIDVPQYQNVSRRHAEILVENGTVWITDLQSTNGTCIDNEIVFGKKVSLGTNSVVKFGNELEANIRIYSSE